MADPVYRPVVACVLGLFRALDIRFDVQGAEHLPESGGAVVALNHISYIDFFVAGVPARARGKRVIRYMAKESIFRHPLAGPLMRGMHHIPVDRAAGAGGYRQALQALRDGELVGVFPEATISGSFTLKDFKTGAVRLAQEAGVPLVPMLTWGGQRVITKGGHHDFRRHVPIWIRVCPPMYPSPGDDPVAITAKLRATMAETLEGIQRAYPDRPAGPEDSWWLPAYLGGGAPTPDEARAIERLAAQGRSEARRRRASRGWRRERTARRKRTGAGS